MIKKYQKINDKDLLFNEILLSNRSLINGTSVLQIGAKPRGSWYEIFEKLRHFGYVEFDVLEIFKQNYQALYGALLNKKILGDIRHFDKLIERKYDLVIFWHGPQLLSKNDFKKIVPKIMQKTNIAFIIACPYGRYEKLAEYGNPYEEHISHWYPEDLEKIGFDAYIIGEKDKRNPMVGVQIQRCYANDKPIPNEQVPQFEIISNKKTIYEPKIIAVMQCYNEVMFVQHSIRAIQPFVDAIITTESCNTPFMGQTGWSPYSTDGTREVLLDLAQQYDNIHFVEVEPIGPDMRNRTNGQGISKRFMFQYGEINNILDDGDWIWIVDADEFYDSESAANVTRLLKTKYKDYDCGRISEWQFAYGMQKAFPSSHGRFMKYMKGSDIRHVHSLIWPNGKTPWNGKEFVIDVQQAIMFHLSYAKHPTIIRQKMLSFNIKHYYEWFNNVYLVYPFDHVAAYNNNQQIRNKEGKGWSIGLHRRLITFEPECIIDACKEFATWDFEPYIQNNIENLIILPGDIINE